MDTIFHGDVHSQQGRRLAWVDTLFVDHGLVRLFWPNRGVVAEGRLYRSSHPTPGQLVSAIRRWGVRTVVNLRGECNNGADALSRDAAVRLGLIFYDAPLESHRPPSRDRLLRLTEIFHKIDEPALIHCKSGADRAGIAAAIFLLLQGYPSEEAKRQLSWRFGHNCYARAGILDLFLDRFATQAEGRMSFEDWVRNEYDIEALRRDFKPKFLASFIMERILRRE